MREILEDAAIVYRHEAESLLIVAAPALVLGPLFVLIASAGLRAALVCVPLLVIVYLATYSANLRAAKLVLDSEEPEPARAFLEALARLPGALVASMPVALIVIATAVSGLLVASEGFVLPAFGLGLFGMFVMLAWAAQHAYDLPLVVGYSVGGLESLRAGRNVHDSAPGWTNRVFIATCLPLAAAWLLCWAFWMMLAPAFGAAVFAAIAAVWLPFASLSFVGACTRLVSDERPAVDRAIVG